MGYVGFRRGVVEALHWLALYAALWALFAEGAGWLLGSLSVAVASAASLWLGLPPARLRFAALPGFCIFFLRHMAVGALDVARRAMHPGRPLAPAWVDYRLNGTSPRVALLLSALVGLLPGTLASEVDGPWMRMHVLDEGQDWHAVVVELERRLAWLMRAEDDA